MAYFKIDLSEPLTTFTFIELIMLYSHFMMKAFEICISGKYV